MHLDKLDKIKNPYKEPGARIRAAAEAANQSLQKYIIQAVEERMQRENDAEK
jgi:hypothetical protein